LLLWLAYGLALFFGLNFAVVEMVIWSHINGYLLVIVFALAATLLSFQIHTQGDASPARRRLLVAGTFLFLLLSAFTYELGQFLAVLAGAVVGLSAWRYGRPGRGLALFLMFASVLPLYQGANFLDQTVHPFTTDENFTSVLER